MSSLLKEAIIDAKALRESALKNAETSVIEKYSEEVKATLEPVSYTHLTLPTILLV